jgi:hypothetical protein
MIHAHIDTVDHRMIVGIETGTRAQFDARHGGDKLWLFVESYRVLYRVDTKDFLRYPHTYKVNALGDLVKTTDAPIIVVDPQPEELFGRVYLYGRDGRFLRGADGAFLYAYKDGYTPPPAGKVYLTDGDGQTILTDGDGAFITEPIDVGGSSTDPTPGPIDTGSGTGPDPNPM